MGESAGGYDRFKSKSIETARQFLNAYFYIANNPVRAGLVDHPLAYEYSGLTFFKKGIHGGILSIPNVNLTVAIEGFLNNYSPEKYRGSRKALTFRDKRPGRPKQQKTQ